VKDELKGRLDYYLRLKPRDGRELFSSSWRGTGPMNGQISRQAAVRQILEEMKPSIIIETGTYRGVTTEWFAQFGHPVRTIEVNPRLHAFAKERLKKLDNVHCHLGRSVDTIKNLRPDPGAFFYLDAHWDADVPVAGELEQIFEHWEKPVVMIDDFQVPGQSYGWLDRGPAAELTPAILGPYETMPRWYPSTPAYKESGQNTGWTILAPGYEHIMDAIPELGRNLR